MHALLKSDCATVAEAFTESRLGIERTPAATSIARLANSDRAKVAVSVRPARTESERRAARNLVQQRYEQRGYRPGDAPAPAAMESGARYTFIAEVRGELVGTVSVRLDGPEGLMAESTYPDEISALRGGGRRLGEVGSLATAAGIADPDVYFALIQSAFGLRARWPWVSDAIIEVNPRHQRFYTRRFGFHVAGPKRHCPRVEAPAILLRLPLIPMTATASVQRYAGTAPAFFDPAAGS